MSEMEYLNQLNNVLSYGDKAKDRTGVGTLSLFGMQARYDLRDGFPLFTTKRVFWRGIVGELLWFLEGSANRNRLEELTHGTVGERGTIWDEWADADGDLGPIYGAQWRDWGGIGGYYDQISMLIDGIKRDPYSRRHIVSAWNVGEVSEMAIPPCHTLWQIKITDERMDLQLYQRSADMFLGVPFNVASYSLMLHMIAHVTGYHPGYFIHSIGDAHIYSNHLTQVEEQLQRKPRILPTLVINRKIDSIFDFKYEDFTLVGYDPHPSIKAEVAV